MDRLLPDKALFTSFWRLPSWIAAAVLLADQLTKVAVDLSWPLHYRRSVIPGFFNLVHLRNDGAAWGIFSGERHFLALISVVVLVAIVRGFSRLTERVPERSLALGAVTGGIAGNLIDRLFRGEVVDFLDVYLGSYHWPAFNIADSAISCGVVVFLLSSFFQNEPVEDLPRTEQQPSEAP